MSWRQIVESVGGSTTEVKQDLTVLSPEDLSGTARILMGFKQAEILRYQIGQERVVPLLASTKMSYVDVAHATHYWLTSKFDDNAYLRGVGKYSDIPGRFRDSHAIVGDLVSDSVYIAPHHMFIGHLMNRWAENSEKSDYSPQSLARDYLFYVALHPQSDTVGRNARLITNVKIYRNIGRTVWFDHNRNALNILRLAKGKWFDKLRLGLGSPTTHDNLALASLRSAKLLSKLMNANIGALDEEYKEVFNLASSAFRMYLFD